MLARTIPTNLDSLQKSLDDSIKKIEDNLLKNDTDSKAYVVGLRTLKSTVLTRYSDAGIAKKEEEKDRLCCFADKFNQATDAMIDPKLSFDECMSAIKDALAAANKCETIVEKIAEEAESKSPFFYVLGGFIGFVIGIPLGVAVGGVVFIAALLYLIITDPITAPDNPLALKIWLGGFAVAGAILGAYTGATFLSEKMKHGYEYGCRLFKPAVAINKLATPLINNEIFCDRTRFQKKALGEVNLPYPLVDIMADYAEKPEPVGFKA